MSDSGVQGQLAGNPLFEQTLDMMQRTLRNARRSFSWVSGMNIAMFAVGLVLFAVSAVYGTFFEHDTVYPLVFSGLGAATFVTLFLTDAIAKTQDALSNLVQVQIGFMQWYSQMQLWTNFPGLQAQSPAEVEARVREASLAIEQRSMEAMRMLQTYTESPPKAAAAAEPAPAPAPGA